MKPVNNETGLVLTADEVNAITSTGAAVLGRTGLPMEVGALNELYMVELQELGAAGFEVGEPEPSPQVETEVEAEAETSVDVVDGPKTDKPFEELDFSDKSPDRTTDPELPADRLAVLTADQVARVDAYAAAGDLHNGMRYIAYCLGPNTAG